MSDEKLIHHMETWLFYHAQNKWGITSEETVDVFNKYGVFDYISDCYDYLHLSSYDLALENIEELLKNKGADIANG